MIITERTLRKWREEALNIGKIFKDPSAEQRILTPLETIIPGYVDRILRMTQELLDQHLMRK